MQTSVVPERNLNCQALVSNVSSASHTGGSFCPYGPCSRQRRGCSGRYSSCQPANARSVRKEHAAGRVESETGAYGMTCVVHVPCVGRILKCLLLQITSMPHSAQRLPVNSADHANDHRARDSDLSASVLKQRLSLSQDDLPISLQEITLKAI